MEGLFIDRYFSADYPELIREISTEVFVRMMESEETKHMGEAATAKFAFDLGEHIRTEFGGTNWYIGKGVRFVCSMRDREIFQRDRGNNIDELARAYGLTPMRIRQILQRQRSEDQRRRQSALFDDEDAELPASR